VPRVITVVTNAAGKQSGLNPRAWCIWPCRLAASASVCVTGVLVGGLGFGVGTSSCTFTSCTFTSCTFAGPLI
jgi:hypothetical protein